MNASYYNTEDSMTIDVKIEPTMDDPSALDVAMQSSSSTQSLELQPMNESLSLVDKLLAFYQQNAVWVHHTRAGLELDLTAQGRDSFSSRRAIAAGPSIVKAEPVSPPPLTKRNSRWLQRKQTFNLNINLNAKLDAAAPASALVRRRRRAQRVASPQTCTQLLDLYSEHMEARMASCVNLAELARSVNQPRPQALSAVA
ncbi:hypothetical protein PENSPDRAFT_656440 [Peniophora sp. CONT]|nr:hypothetical protein PENSPDRAFT_656440 [Peniophora sp. CONT]